MRRARTSQIYGARRSFATRAAADNLLRHITRELTAGGLPHWVEACEQAPDNWLAIVHRVSCGGGLDCECGSASLEN